MSHTTQGLRVCVVEDDRSIRETLGMVLEAEGFLTDLIEDGERALDYLENEWPDVLLLDLTLQGISGEEVYQRILERHGRTPYTIVLSADQQGARRTVQMPGALFLAKPYTIEQLVGLLRQNDQRSAA